MTSSSGRYVITFNGEIYNFAEIRQTLLDRGCTFRGHSDTEIILAAVETWGPEAVPAMLHGMFAIALWDQVEDLLFLIRDRFGKKPLYCGWQDGTFLFGSELKALRAHPSFLGRINRSTLAGYFQFNCVPGNHSIYEGIFKVPPGSFMVIHPDRPDQVGPATPYWDSRKVAREGQRHPFSGTETEAIDHLQDLLADAVRRRMVADVPVGAFLSGGLDSSLVVAFMQAAASRPVKTFTIGLPGLAGNEAEFGLAVARHLGTEHTELYVTPQDALAVIPKLPAIYDEPFADSSQIPTYLVSQLARSQVTVALSGDGGDEVFGGYNRYHIGSKIFRRIQALPVPLRKGMAAALLRVPLPTLDTITNALTVLLPDRYRIVIGGGERIQKFARSAGADSFPDYYQRLISHWIPEDGLVLGEEGAKPYPLDLENWDGLDAPENSMMLSDLRGYLIDDILVKVDRASMAVGLECRAPLLDHRIAEFAWTLPLSMKIQDGEGKRILRKLLYRHVPQELVDRPKQGFGVPIGEWLRGPLRPWVEELISESRLRQEGFLAPQIVRKAWAEHLESKRDWQFPLWDVLMFQAWLDSVRSNS